jgi:hypothetical protein
MDLPNIGKKAVTLLILFPLVGLLANAVAGSNNYLLLMTTALVIFLTVLTRFQVSLLLIGLASYFLSYTIWFFSLPSPLINLGYALIVMMLLRELFFTPFSLPARTHINYLLLSIIALGCLSIAGSEAGIYPSIKGLLRHVAFPLMFIMILMAEPDEKLMRRLIIGIIVVAFVQVVASIMQYTWYTNIAPKPFGTRVDLSGGVLGFSCGGYTAVFMTMIYCLFFGLILVRGFRWSRATGAALLFVPIFLASARAGVFLMALATFYMLLITPFFHGGVFIKRLFTAGIIGIALVIGIQVGLGGRGFDQILNPDYVYTYSARPSDAGLGRLQAFSVIQDELRSPFEMAVGRGPGMLTPTSIVDNPNSLIALNPRLYGTVTGYAYTVLEVGYLGLVCDFFKGSTIPSGNPSLWDSVG